MTLPQFAAVFKDTDLGLPKDPHRNVIWARILGLNEPKVTEYMHGMAQQRRGELAAYILENQNIYHPASGMSLPTELEIHTSPALSTLQPS